MNLNKKFWPSLKIVFVPISLKTMRKNHTSPNNGPIQIFLQPLTNNEKKIVQNSKSEPKKFSLLCTFRVCCGHCLVVSTHKLSSV
jgi:hypothetical protein